MVLRNYWSYLIYRYIAEHNSNHIVFQQHCGNRPLLWPARFMHADAAGLNRPCLRVLHYTTCKYTYVSSRFRQWTWLSFIRDDTWVVSILHYTTVIPLAIMPDTSMSSVASMSCVAYIYESAQLVYSTVCMPSRKVVQGIMPRMLQYTIRQFIWTDQFTSTWQ